MSGYVSSFFEDTINYICGLKVNNKQITEDDIISVEVGNDVVTWECFQKSSKDILWDSSHNSDDVRGDIKIYGKRFIMYLSFDKEYNSYSWNSLFLPNSLKPNKEIKHVNVRPKDFVEYED